MASPWKKYLFWFAQEHVDFRYQEIQSILQILNISMKWVESPTPKDPYWIVELPSDDEVKRIASRSVALRSCSELWAYEKNIPDLHDSLRNISNDSIERYLKPDKSFKISVETFCKHFSQKDKVKKIETFSYLPISGPVCLTNPDVCLLYYEYYGLDPNNIPEKPHAVFFSRWITDGARHLISKLSLKNRKFIGNTSMDAQLSLLMANQAGVLPGHLVLDPFVGSGSLLVAAAHFGAYVIGTDIDFLMLHARSRPSRITQRNREKDESILSNMKQYNLGHLYIDVIVTDFSLPLWESSTKFDAIITDPPYGIREATERIGIEKENYELSEKHLLNHIPAKVDYGLIDIYKDLLKFASVHLNMYGRLVCWFPVYREDYREEELPHHPCLKLITNSEQILSKHTSRRLLTYEKMLEPTDDMEIGPVNMRADFREKYFALGEEMRRTRQKKTFTSS